MQKKLWTLGVDESGTGALAGPFMVAAVLLPTDDKIPGVRDSKKLTAARREKLAETIRHAAKAVWVEKVQVETIKKLGQSEAWATAAVNAITHVFMRAEALGIHKQDIGVVIDGLPIMNLSHRLRAANIVHRFLVGADDTVMSVSAASIMAKTCRDNTMTNLGKDYPEYMWKKNKGYGTEAHFEAIAAYGITPLHRDLALLRGLPHYDETKEDRHQGHKH